MKIIDKININIEDVKKEISANIGKQIRIQESNHQGKRLKNIRELF